MWRVYPGAARIDSSNFEPHTLWGCGAHMVGLSFQTHAPPSTPSLTPLFSLHPRLPSQVALNFQTAGTPPYQLARGLFRANGGAGYVPKPPALLAAGASGGPVWDALRSAVTVVRVRLLWAELLPPLHGARPYVASHADEAKDLHPPPAQAAAALEAEELRPYVTVEALGGKFAGAASSYRACVDGSVWRSDWATSGFMPAWNQV